VLAAQCARIGITRQWYLKEGRSDRIEATAVVLPARMRGYLDDLDHHSVLTRGLTFICISCDQIAVETPVLDRFGEVRGLDRVLAFKVRDGPGHL